ncbi:MAG: hypothetical protein ACR2PZ_22540 [Pseudomonadales bacterium]
MLKKLQAGTGLLFAAFVAVHLTNTWLASLGAAAYDSVQQYLRVIYQFPPVEVLVLAALATHLLVGLLRIWQEPRRVLNLRARLHRYAGFFLALVIGGHILAVRGSSWFYDVYPEFAGLAYSVSAVPGYFYPYYFLLGVAGFYHALNGVAIAAPRLGWSISVPTPTLRLATSSAAVLTLSALMGLGGVWTDVGEPAQSEFAQLARDIFGDLAP